MPERYHILPEKLPPNPDEGHRLDPRIRGHGAATALAGAGGKLAASTAQTAAMARARAHQGRARPEGRLWGG